MSGNRHQLAGRTTGPATSQQQQQQQHQKFQPSSSKSGSNTPMSRSALCSDTEATAASLKHITAENHFNHISMGTLKVVLLKQTKSYIYNNSSDVWSFWTFSTGSAAVLAAYHYTTVHSCAGVCGPALTSRSVCSPAPRYSEEECGGVFCDDELSDIRSPYCEGSDRMLSVLSVSLPLGPGASSGESVAVRRAGSRAAPPSCSHTYGAATTENHRRVHLRVKLPPSRTQGKETR